MCGIVGYIGNRDAFPILIKGLHRLEYRGYDSAGVALLNQKDELNIYKAKGKVADLETVAADKDCSGSIGIAHTRWATHGEPSVRNAHPHVSESGNLAIVHNGIIENYAVLREQLKAKGYHFQSDTDTEVLVQLIQFGIDEHGFNLLEAVTNALRKCIGAYAIVVVDKNCPNQIVAARKGSPMVIGVGQNNEEFFIASDATPIVEYTKNVVYVDDEQVACIECGKDLQIYNLDETQAEIVVKHVDLDINMLSKGGYPHFMLKEIHDQPDCMRDCMRGRIVDDEIKLSAVDNFGSRLLHARRFIIVACGTSWHAGLIGKQLIEEFCRIPVEVDYASEFRYRNPVLYPDDVVIAVSQSGETADTLAAIRLAKDNGCMIFGIVNAVGSSIARETDTGIYIHVGPEIGVASTKAFTGQVFCFEMLALALGKANGKLDDKRYKEMVEELQVIPEKIEKILEQDDAIEHLARRFTYAHNFLYLGRGWNYPVALEGALKLKEISYIHAEGYPAAEMKHGPIALVDADMPCLFIATHHEGYEKIISNMQEVKARGGNIIAVATEGDEEISKIADEIIYVPSTINWLVPLLSVIPLQLLSYYVAVDKGLNVDMPRNLAKSVTVE
ncbi:MULTISPECIES: glutamine--fructose-6-phosphate transaminase (isomerizing) [Segatella]|jgi:glucosamine--fructose-6-phosphate aminotransferase (isomerizing)|uniref:Glutamine--fructose-6-phosphate aminotransferase [isomerizing] n=1 Tax=Segatella bryantii TaxID=77095 RepID=A0ABX4EGM9_SEGBR|nr:MULTISPECIES: glutamine--fructose-6-phosphate transaminase (isomerizing) [Segatella]OYP54883.1 glutamine--fructose-6-phosphate transaminase (isomerizing) [Segatella bryantii]UKK75034.1 glutamine--fructose-6-phosphate transaminase (isomerizing) [Segatella bryantii]UKK82084.1 glutamine--fructose-6-phosphate transaminase (isomerizing) [Segatella bryantii]SEA63167.1 glutamine--fructose-6-phosphate transaminase [Segatella bryantii]